MTAKLSFCIKAATTLHADDLSDLTDSIEHYVKAGIATELAETMAVNDILAAVRAEHASMVGDLKAQHPDLFKSDRPALPAPAAAPRAPKVSKNTIFTDDAANKARELLRKRLGGTLNTGMDPEVLQAGLTLAGWHIENGARTFAAFTKAMLEDMGDIVKPYLKSWYAAAYYHPSLAQTQGEMTPLTDLDKSITPPQVPENLPPHSTEPDHPPIVEHVTKNGAGKTIRGVIRTDLTKEQAKAIDEFTFKKDGGYFIREKHLDALNAAHPIGAPKAEDTVQHAPAPEKSLTDHLYEQIKAGGMPKDNLALKRVLADFDGKAVTPARWKQGQEALEAAIVQTARDTIERKQSTQATFDMLVRLYDSQPLLNARTSTSVENQAYSTPAPLALVASKLAGITRTSTVAEPTAGNGMLLIGADPKLALVNELNEDRATALRAQGFEVTTQDAAMAPLITPKSVDAVVTNPPFGGLKEKAQFDGYTLSQIDHLIAANALDGMKDDGRATLILGANKVTGEKSNADLVFFNWLYTHYNVAAHFEVDGKLYERQGAGWPVRVIAIEGRKVQPAFQASPEAEKIKRATTWGEVYEQYQAALDSGRNSESPVGAVPGRPSDTRAVPVVPAVPSGRADSSRPEGGAQRAGNVAGERPGAVVDRGAKPIEPVGPSAGAERPTKRPAAEPVGGRSNERGALPEPAGNARSASLSDAENQFQAKYVPRSSNRDSGILIPVNMAGPLQSALDTLEDQIGDIDEFVRAELGYETIEDMHSTLGKPDGLMGLQVDSVASAIHQMKNGKGIIIADQTGIGKGRQAAAIIRWSVKNGHIPVFMSADASLFTDMYNDLHDIGSDDIAPFIFNSEASIKGSGDEKLFANKEATHEAAIRRMVDEGEIPEDRNAVFLTYSQISKPNVKNDALSALAGKGRAIFILDESHTAGGASQTGEYMRGVLELAKGVTYLSATYAKRPDNMPIYFKTDIGSAAASDEGLAAAMAAGGLPLQTVVSNNLVRAGQMFRRERSYEGVAIDSRADTARRAEHEKLSDETTLALRSIVEADAFFHDNYVKDLERELKREGSRVRDVAGNQARASVDHTEFSSVVHNFVRQMLLGLKAQNAADEAIASLKRGEKPLIALESTMGTFLANYVEENGIKVGDSLGTFDYRDVLRRALERTRVVQVQLPNGRKEKRNVALEELHGETREKYDQALAVIDGLRLSIPVSPIDWMRNELEKAGYSVAEITGRTLIVDYSDPKNPKLGERSKKEQNDKVLTGRRFNGGIHENPIAKANQLDALILNVAGSTGISLHASEKFTDQRQRHMIVVQPAQNINIFMQMLGRIHRTGQVVLPKYTLMSVDLPTEKRPTALLAKKMKSLNANTSSNTESATSVKAYDMLNKYGDEIVDQYLEDNPQLIDLLDVRNKMGEPDIARTATGRLALLPIKTQEQVYGDLEEQYGSLIDYLNKTNQNELEPRTFDFDAKELRQDVLYEGQDKESPFGQDAIYGEYSVKAQGRAMTPEEIKTLTDEHLAGKTPQAHIQGLIAHLKAPFQHWYSGLDVGGQLIANQVSAAAIHFLDNHPIGSTFRVDINGDTYNAVVTNIRTTHKSTGNPFALSKTQVTIAVNGALRSVTMAATKFRTIEVSRLGDGYRIESLFEKQPDNQRETAKIVTGNLLGAYGEIGDTKASIITFTKEDGSTEQGILLPKKFSFAKDVRKDFRLQTPADALRFLAEGYHTDLAKYGINSRDNNVRVLPNGEGITIQVPASKARGGQFFLNQTLRNSTGDFYKQGAFMRASIDDAKTAKEALATLMRMKALYALPSMAEEARRLSSGTENLSISDDSADTELLPVPEAIEAGPVHSGDAAALARLESAFRAKVPAFKGLKLTALPRVAKPGPRDSQIAHDRYAAVDLMEKAYGKRVVFFHSSTQFANGVQADYLPNYIFVNENTTRPIMAVLGHELLHSLRVNHPEIYNRLSDRLRAVLENPGDYSQWLNARRASKGMDALSFDKGREELIANIVGDNFTDPRFWRQMSLSQPSMFGRVLRVIRDFFDSLLSKLKNERPYGTDRYLNDIQAARDAVVDAMRQFSNDPKTAAAAVAQAADANLSETNEPFYSELARQVDTAKMSSAPAQGWADWLKGLTNKGTIKADEIAWTGLDDWLKMQPGKISREQVQQFLQGNGVKVTEITLADDGSTDLPDGWHVRLAQEGDDVGDHSMVLVDQHDEVRGSGDTSADAIADGWDADSKAETPTKYSNYTLPGGANYREVLLTLPPSATRQSADEKLARVNDFKRSMIEKYGERWLPKATPEELDTNARLSREMASEIVKAPDYKSGHWDQPNVLAHIRLNDRTSVDPMSEQQQVDINKRAEIQSQVNALDKKIGQNSREARRASDVQREELRAKLMPRVRDGEMSPMEMTRQLEDASFPVASVEVMAMIRERDALLKSMPPVPVQKTSHTLFVEEIQSDWGQTGKDARDKQVEALMKAEGITKEQANKRIPPGAGFRSASEVDPGQARALAYTAAREAMARNDDLGFDSHTQAIDAIRKDPDWRTRWEMPDADAAIVQHYVDMPPADKAGVIPKVPAAPFVGKTDAWVSLAIKRIIKLAVDGGYDRVAFINGQQSTDRYWGNEIVRPAVERWNAVTEPQSIRELGQDVLGRKMDSAMALPPMDGGVLAVLKHDQVRKAVVARIPVDVVNVLAHNGFRAEQLLGDGDVVLDGLSANARDRTLSALGAAIRETATSVAAKLRTLTPGSGDLEVLPALRASQLDTREVAGLLDPVRLFHDGAGARPQAAAAAGSGAKPAAGAGSSEFGAAALAENLNAHAAIMGRDGLLRQGVEPPPSEGMKAFYDKIVPSVAKDVLRKIGGGTLAKVELQIPGQRKGDTDRATGAAIGPNGTRGQNLDATGFDITDSMREKAAGGLPMFDLKDYTDEQRDALARAGIDTRTRLQRAGDRIRLYYDKMTRALRSNYARQFQQGFLDQFTGIKEAVKNEIGGLPTDQDPYVAARLANGGVSSVMRGLMLHGQARWAANGQHLEKIPGTEGLLDILKPLGNDLNDFFGWMIGNRAARLMAEGRENNFTEEQIKVLQALSKGKEAEFRRAALAYASFKRSVLDIAEGAGLLDGEGRKVWDQADYIPFYRQMDDRAVFSATGKKGLSGQTSGIRTLKGGESALNDPMENILMNFSRLVDASLKNNALRKTVDVLTGVKSGIISKVGYDMSRQILPAEQIRGVLERAGTPDQILDIIPPDAFEGMAKMWAIQRPADKDVVQIMVNGKPQFYKVHDPLLLRALTSFVPFDFPGLGVARAFKRVLTASVTITPDFGIRNYMRDTVASAIIARHGYNPLKALDGFKKSLTETGLGEDALFAGASFSSGFVNASDPKATGIAMRRALRKKGFSASSANDFIASIVDTPLKFWEKYRHVGESIENANREAIGEATLKATGSSTRAAYEMKDAMDFSLRGSSPVYQVVADTVPFFNAMVQGMYRLGRADPKRVAMYGMMLTAATLALAAANYKRPEYEELPDWDKDGYWHFWIPAPGLGSIMWDKGFYVAGQKNSVHIRIPKPFEIGAIFASMPERLLRYTLGQESGKKTVREFLAIIGDQVKLDPTPQLIKPLIGAISNTNTFTGAPIETAGDQNLPASARESARTSPTVKAAIKAMNFDVPGFEQGAMDMAGLSPKKLEYLLTSYLGSAGAFSLGMVDIATRALNGDKQPPQPAKRLDQIPFIGSFVREDPALATVYETDLYKLRDEMDKVHVKLKALRGQGRDDEADAYEKSREKQLDARRVLDKAGTRLAKLHKSRDEIYADPDMTPREKRAALDDIAREQSETARDAVQDEDVLPAR